MSFEDWSEGPANESLTRARVTHAVSTTQTGVWGRSPHVE
jgi:hypothetical protein